MSLFDERKVAVFKDKDVVNRKKKEQDTTKGKFNY